MSDEYCSLLDHELKLVRSAIHLHLCKDTFINSNDFVVLLSEYLRNDKLTYLYGYINPQARLTKILRHYLMGLTLDTQLKILSSINSNQGKLLLNGQLNLEYLNKPTQQILLSWQNFVDAFFKPVFQDYTHLFISLGFNEETYTTLYEKRDGIDSLFSHFLFLSNYIFNFIGEKYNLPIIALRALPIVDDDCNLSIDKDLVTKLLQQKLQSQIYKVESMRQEYCKELKGFSNLTYGIKKRVITRLSRKPFRTVKQRLYISAYELIQLLENPNINYLDLFSLDKVFTMNYYKGAVSQKENRLLNIETVKLLEIIFFHSRDDGKVVLTQEFSRNFDYNKYKEFALKYGVKTFPSSTTTWKENDCFQDGEVKKMSFIFGLEYLYKNYVK